MRFLNLNDIINNRSNTYGETYLSEDVKINYSGITLPESVEQFKNLNLEYHLYSFTGDLIYSNHSISVPKLHKNSVILNLNELLSAANIVNGSFILNLNFHRNIFGAADNKVLIAKEISSDGLEVKLSIQNASSLISAANSLIASNQLTNLILNFGNNRSSRITNIKFDSDNVYVRLYSPIDNLEEKESGWIVLEVLDSFFDVINVNSLVDSFIAYEIGQPNFDLDAEIFSGESTIFKSFDDLLSENLPTKQRIIDNVLSGSGIDLNIDYTNFENFVFYSSATERVENFVYKVGQIELLQSGSRYIDTNYSSSVYITREKNTKTDKINRILNTFDSFESWLYYSNGDNTFSYDISGSVTPYPKYVSASANYLYPLTSSQAVSWYESLLTDAEDYDSTNDNRLYWTIPEHILMDENNSNFVAFVEMIGEYYDGIYSYIHALTRIHDYDEHPNRGTPNKLLPNIAESFGWQLENSKGFEELWKYKTDLGEDGNIKDNDIYTLSSEKYTENIWKRIVNNLPFLYKTKGTTRSIKALMSIYGIPQTLLTIKEFGGPNDDPVLIRDKYNYALYVSGSQTYIETERCAYTQSLIPYEGTQRSPDTVEFRILLENTGSIDPIYTINSGSYTFFALDAIKYEAGIYSGSGEYGRFRLFAAAHSGSSSNVVMVNQTEYLPIYNGDFWTVRLYKSMYSGSIVLNVAQAPDCLNGEITHNSTLILTPPSASYTFDYFWNPTGRNQYTNRLFGTASYAIPGAVGEYIGVPLPELDTIHDPEYMFNKQYSTVLSSNVSSINPQVVPLEILFDTNQTIQGFIQGYKEYYSLYSTGTFHEHVRNPQAYNDDNLTQSYNSLIRYYPLGVDTNIHDHVVYTNVSSSHPNQMWSTGTTASFVNFNHSRYVSVNETYYIETPTLGGNALFSKKIRLDTEVLDRPLSNTTSVVKSKYDWSPVDSNKAHIVFSPSDQVNTDILNQFGSFAMDDFIGDPETEFEVEYRDLRTLKDAYYKKYSNRNNVNNFIRALSVYDYTFFSQLKQLIPARVNLVDGILIENDLLHRNKTQLSKRPAVENPQWDASFSREFEISSEIEDISGSLSHPLVVSLDYTYYTSSISFLPEVCIEHSYYTASVERPISVLIEATNYPELKYQRTGLMGSSSMFYNNPLSGSKGETGSMYENQYLRSNCYSKVIYYYSASGEFATEYERKWMTMVSMSYKKHYSSSLEPYAYQYSEACGAVENRSRFAGTKMNSSDFNIDSSDTIDGGPVITVYEVTDEIDAIFVPNDSIGNIKIE